MKTTRRIKGEGTIFQVTPDKWCARVPASPETGGKIKTFSGKTKAAVAKKIKAFREEMQNGFLPEKSTTMGEYVKKWLYEVKIMQLKPLSMDRLESTVNNHIIPNIGLYALSQVTADLVQDKIINSMKQANYSMSSIKKAHDALNDCFEYTSVRQKVHPEVSASFAAAKHREHNFYKVCTESTASAIQPDFGSDYAA